MQELHTYYIHSYIYEPGLLKDRAMIKTRDNESQGQAVYDERVSYLHITPL